MVTNQRLLQGVANSVGMSDLDGKFDRRRHAGAAVRDPQPLGNSAIDTHGSDGTHLTGAGRTLQDKDTGCR